MLLLQHGKQNQPCQLHIRDGWDSCSFVSICASLGPAINRRGARRQSGKSISGEPRSPFHERTPQRKTEFLGFCPNRVSVAPWFKSTCWRKKWNIWFLQPCVFLSISAFGQLPVSCDRIFFLRQCNETQSSQRQQHYLRQPVIKPARRAGSHSRPHEMVRSHHQLPQGSSRPTGKRRRHELPNKPRWCPT